MAQEKELKKLRIYLKTKQLNKLNDIDMGDISLSMKIEALLDVALKALKDDERDLSMEDTLWLESN